MRGRAASLSLNFAAYGGGKLYHAEVSSLPAPTHLLGFRWEYETPPLCKKIISQVWYNFGVAKESWGWRGKRNFGV